jgi:Rho termination factor, N-terminal domain
MNLSDTFYVALCMTVLILGAVYWFWTQNQFMLRKLSLLENIVYEMKMALSTAPPAATDTAGFGSAGTTSYAPAPGSVMSDDDAELLNDDLHVTLGGGSGSGGSGSGGHEESESASSFVPISQDSPVLQVSESSLYSKPADEVSADAAPVDLAPPAVNDDLQPGGVGSGVAEVKTGGGAYDNMKLTELRRLAENRGISGAKEMRKQALIDALRNAPAGGTFDLNEGVLELN